ncbi:aspartate aminotransferase family protein [Caminibacter pacificus]|uniref:Acetylornithine aminotransferase n=1 Tax=Caminibacter pacificus TaxID=1424653 RepID=A0AAJ4UXN8_9BACT|nr:aspartate aminotransferase family protein [Caminibacter pacificus]QCI27969.1 aspartate aminotransferase family protein [Caminibacter pacificus]ROR39845.1 acetylornithine aminotransferase [Caminibacter pacificus]
MQYLLNTYARFDVEFVRGESATLWDKDNNEYIDFTSGIGVVSVGHGNVRLSNAICEQARNIIHISNLYRIPPQEKLAEILVKKSGLENGGVFFCNSGAEANETALKIARKYGEINGEIKRYKVITLENSFHGRTISTLKATGQPKFHQYFGPFPDGFTYAKNIEDIYNKIDDKTIAVMIELIQGEGGVNPFDIREIQKLSAELKKRDILLIVDEVQTGIYRTGEFLASNLYKINPDIVTLAKGLGGGVPIGAVITTLSDVLKPGDHGSTFGGNYLSTRAGLEVIKILDEYYESGMLKETTEYFENRLLEIVKEFPDKFESVSGFGLMRALRAHSVEVRDEVVKKAFENRVLVLKAGEKSVRFLPPLTITKEEIDEGFDRLKESIK